MVSMVKLDAGFDPYSAYTSVLKRSAHIASDDSKVETAQKTESKGLINSSNPVEDDATKSADGMVCIAVLIYLQRFHHSHCLQM